MEDIWKEAKSQLGWSSPGPPTAVMDNWALKTNQEEVANVMNEKLTNKGKEEKSQGWMGKTQPSLTCPV